MYYTHTYTCIKILSAFYFLSYNSNGLKYIIIKAILIINQYRINVNNEKIPT